MKSFVLFLSLTLLTLTAAKAASLDQQIEGLKRQGYVVTMGELTGAGGRLSISRLQGFIHTDGIVHKKECTAIAVKASSNQADPKVSDITKVRLGDHELSAKEFVGFFGLE